MRISRGYSVDRIVINYGLENPGFESLQGQKFSVCSKRFKRAVSPTQPTIQWYLNTFRV